MDKPTDIRPAGCELRFIPATLRVPLRFGNTSTTQVACARVRATARDRGGRSGSGWGETPLNVEWLWPSDLPWRERDAALRDFCRAVARAVAAFRECGHAMELGFLFTRDVLPGLVRDFNRTRADPEPLPWLAALACFSPFDIALHDAFANLAGRFVYDTYDAQHMNRDLADYFGDGRTESFRGRYPADFFASPPAMRLAAWHLVGGADPLDRDELDGNEPDDGRPVLLADWIARDGLQRIKVKLRGDDAAWDFARLVKVGETALRHGVGLLSADFNCTVREPEYVCGILDRLALDRPAISDMLLYVEQPFPRDLDAHPIDVAAAAARKPLFMDESAHDWERIRRGRELGWTGVALKTCKTQTGALLGHCWAKAAGMGVVVQDLTNPMLAQIPHLLLASRAAPDMGVETNSMQFCPDASEPEARVHPGMYARRGGAVDLRTLGNTGFGCRADEMRRVLPEGEAFGTC